jgi:hypothetical protein
MGQHYECEIGCTFSSYNGSDRVCYACYTDSDGIMSRKKRFDLLWIAGDELRQSRGIEIYNEQFWECKVGCMFQSKML